jgi:phage gpG-like protein
MKEIKQDIVRMIGVVTGFSSRVATIANDLFDQNLERESFFGQSWPVSEYVKKTRSGGKMLQKTGRLRRSIKYKQYGNVIIFSSNAPYAEIHNEGGTIKHPGGTAYFYNKNKGETIWVSNRAARGKKYPRTRPHNIEMPQRQFIGDHRQLQKEIEKELDRLFDI